MARTRRSSPNATASGSGSNVIAPEVVTAVAASRKGSSTRKPRYQDMLLVAMSNLKKNKFSKDELVQAVGQVAQKLNRAAPLREYYLLSTLNQLLIHDYVKGNQDASYLQLNESLRDIIDEILREAEGNYVTRDACNALTEHCELFRRRVGVLRRHSKAELQKLVIEARATSWPRSRQGSRETSRASSPLTDLDEAMEEDDSDVEVARGLGNEMQVDNFEDLASMAGPSNLQMMCSSPIRRELSPGPCAAYPTPTSMPVRRIPRIPTASPPPSPTPARSPLSRHGTGNSMFFRQCMEEKDEELCNLRQSNLTYKEELAKQNEELDRYKQDLAAKDERIKNYKDELLEMGHQLTALRQEVSAYQGQITNLTETITELRKQIDDQAAQIQQSAEERRALEEREQTAQEEIEVLRQQLHTCTDEIKQQEEIRAQIARLSGPRDLNFLARMNI
ncbi:hypothetical protein BDN72DRAFT_832738 [Pluteus cervinus]|uniref:Uncharacterized protein n=1 Tax=Pluteus cervinus TaxID=181527 RepID=A0ACD3BBK2_9AGAR|nr:hypothetical protein BDN72DRAFT_832738 [Pluteus cervinus]